LEEARKLAVERTNQQKLANKRYNDKKRADTKLQPGYLVLLKSYLSVTTLHQPKFFGPFKILQFFNAVLLQIQDVADPTRSPLTVHLNQIRPYYSRN
jgi:hypothetical protein